MGISVWVSVENATNGHTTNSARCYGHPTVAVAAICCRAAANGCATSDGCCWLVNIQSIISQLLLVAIFFHNRMLVTATVVSGHGIGTVVQVIMQSENCDKTKMFLRSMKFSVSILRSFLCFWPGLKIQLVLFQINTYCYLRNFGVFH